MSPDKILTQAKLLPEDHPVTKRALAALGDLTQRCEEKNGTRPPLRINVADTSVPWAGVFTEPGRRGKYDILITRGLIRGLDHEDIVAVLGHEWGHIVAPKNYESIAIHGFSGFVSLMLHAWLANWLLGQGWLGGGALMLLMLSAMTTGAWLLTRWVNVSRHRDELRCDAFAATWVGREQMMKTLRRVDFLMRQHWTPYQQHTLAWWGPSHPELSARLKNLNKVAS